MKALRHKGENNKMCGYLSAFCCPRYYETMPVLLRSTSCGHQARRVGAQVLLCL
jgi:hypothetical protein